VVKIKETKIMMFTVRKAIPEDAGAIIEFQLKMAWETEKTTLDRDTVTKVSMPYSAILVKVNIMLLKPEAMLWLHS